MLSKTAGETKKGSWVVPSRCPMARRQSVQHDRMSSLRKKKEIDIKNKQCSSRIIASLVSLFRNSFIFRENKSF